MANNNTERSALLAEPNFRWLLGGGIVSGLGDQFTLIALPWLVLQMTGDPLKLGLVLAMMGVPRAVFILVGGALVDRHSPKRVLMLSKYANVVLLGLLAALVLSQRITLPIVYALALALGLASAFSIPSGTSIMPQVVAPARLHMANGLMMGIRQLTALGGPLLAGLLIAFSDPGALAVPGAAAGTTGATTGALPEANGLGLAFALDCLSFAISAWTLRRVATPFAGPRAAPQPVLRAVGAGLAMVWGDRALRTCFLYWALISFVIGGAFQVALPVLARENLQGAAALGLLMGAHGLGNLLGMASNLKGALRIGNFGTTLLVVDGVAGLLLIPLGFIDAAWQGALLLLCLGTLSGFMQIAVFSWIQRRVPPAMLGRAMSIFMFIIMGLAPLSAALAGLLMRSVSLAQLFAGAGCFLLAATVLAYTLTAMGTIRDAPA